MAKKVVIIGGGFAGLTCARQLANDKRFDVVLLDKQNHHLFQPLLYQVASATLAAPDIARSLRGVLSKARNVSVFLEHVTDINPVKKTVKGKKQSYEYDYLLIATGTRTSWFGNDQWEKHTIGLKHLRDSYQIRQKLLTALERAEIIDDEEEQKRLMTVVIVGGGPTGVELAGAFEDLVQLALHSDFRKIDPTDLRTILIQSGDRILKAFPEHHSTYAKERLEGLGVEIMLNNRVVDVCDGVVQLKSGETIEAETIIWAAGQKASRCTDSLEVEKDRCGRPVVETDLSLKAHPDIFVAGDVASVKDKNGVDVPGLAPAAVQMGKHIAKLLKEEARLEGTKFSEKKRDLRPQFTYWDKGIMAIIGRQTAVVSSKQLDLNGLLAWLAWLFIHILFLVGFRNKISVLLQWAFAYISKKPGSRVFSIKEPVTEEALDEPCSFKVD